MKVIKVIGIILLNLVYTYHHPLDNKKDVAMFLLFVVGITFYTHGVVDEE